jgi:hypothetical protein
MIIRWKYILLAVDMGLGKSAAALTAINALYQTGRINRVLIVAPLLVATDTWPDELDVWEHTCDLDYVVCVGTPAERKAALKRKALITIVNRENFVWLVNQHKGWPWPYDFVLWDESSSLKSWSMRTQSKDPKKRNLTRFGALAQIRQRVEYMVLMSGTPAPNGLIDLGGQAYILDQGERLGENVTAFRERYFDSDYMGWKYTPKPDAQDKIMDKLSDLMVTLRSEDYLELPKFIVNDRLVRLPRRIMDEYEEFEEELVSEAYDVEAVSSGVLAGKLLQFANGSMYQETNKVTRHRPVVPIHDYKLWELESVLEEAAGESVLVAYSFQFDRDRILKRWPKMRLIAEEKNGIKDWNAGKIQHALVHPANIGHGTNIQHGGHIICWYGVPWSLELYQQLNARLWRSGQSALTVICHRILCRGTLDMTVADTLEQKDATQDAITNRVRKRMFDIEDWMSR